MDCKQIFEIFHEERLGSTTPSLWSIKKAIFQAEIGYESAQARQGTGGGRRSKNDNDARSEAHRREMENVAREIRIPRFGAHSPYSLRNGRLSGWAIDQYRDILSHDVHVAEFDWDEADQNKKLQVRLLTELESGIVVLRNIPQIPQHFESIDKPFYGFDSEDNGYGFPHFYQFAADDRVAFSYSFRLLYKWAAQTYGLKRGKHLAWATNLEYDFGNIIKDWDIDSKSMDVRWRRGKLAKVSLKYDPAYNEWGAPSDGASTLDLWDTTNHWMMSVEKMGEKLTDILGFEFKKLPKDFYSFKYAAMDAIISRSYAAIQKAEYDKRRIPLKLTPGATAFKWYIDGQTENGEKFCTQKVYNTHAENELEWMMEGLRGGRTEVFSLQQVEEKVGYFDINSAYPFSMLNGVFPHLSKHDWYIGHERIARQLDNGMEGMVECEVDATEVSEFAKEIPYLGILDKDTMRLIFPLGRWLGKYTFFEIRQAQKYGYKFKFKKAIIYQVSREHPFKHYVEAAYQLRLDGASTGNLVLRDIGKSLGNNLYGKWSQRMILTELRDPDDYKPEDLVGCARIGDAVIMEEDSGFAMQTNVIWGAYTTSICRDLLYTHMMNAWLKGNKVLYCDTDSIFITGGEWPENDPNRIGALKHEADLIMFKALLPKTYMYHTGKEEVFKAKGVPYSQRQQFFTSGQVEYRKPLKIRESLRRRSFNKIDEAKGISGSVPGVNAWITVTKELKGAYTKRTTLPDGTTIPLWINKLEEEPEKLQKAKKPIKIKKQMDYKRATNELPKATDELPEGYGYEV